MNNILEKFNAEIEEIRRDWTKFFVKKIFEQNQISPSTSVKKVIGQSLMTEIYLIAIKIKIEFFY